MHVWKWICQLECYGSYTRVENWVYCITVLHHMNTCMTHGTRKKTKTPNNFSVSYRTPVLGVQFLSLDNPWKLSPLSPPSFSRIKWTPSVEVLQRKVERVSKYPDPDLIDVPSRARFKITVMIAFMGLSKIAINW